MKKTILGVCACPVGIAHTYMAADAIEAAAKKLGFKSKVETQGSSGLEDELTDKDLREAELIVIATAVKIEGEDRFNDYKDKIVEVSLKEAISNSKNIIEKALNL